MIDDDIWRQFVEAYDIDVAESAVEDELAYIKLEMKHRMQYDRLTGGRMHLLPDYELAQQEAQLRAAAMFEAKEPLVLKDVIKRQGFTATAEELEEEALLLAERQGSTMEMVKSFFGEDLKHLERDVIERKAREWACGQSNLS